MAVPTGLFNCVLMMCTVNVYPVAKKEEDVQEGTTIVAVKPKVFTLVLAPKVALISLEVTI